MRKVTVNKSKRSKQQAFYAHELPKKVTSEIGTLVIHEKTKKYDKEYKS